MFGEEIGRIYVAEYFPAAHRAEVNTMVGYLRDTYRERIGKLDWMDAPTKAAAITKLDKVASHIGYPERWHDRSSIRITALTWSATRSASWTGTAPIDCSNWPKARATGSFP